MTYLSERIANEHTLVHADNPFSAPTGCRCGDPWTTPEDRLHHLTAVTERAVRDATAQQLANLEHTRAMTQAAIRDGVTIQWVEGFDAAAHTAARIAREGTTP